MKTKLLILTMLLFTIRFALCAGPFVSEIINSSDPPVQITLASGETFHLYTFSNYIFARPPTVNARTFITYRIE